MDSQEAELEQIKKGSRESDNVDAIGWLIMFISIVSSFICAVSFGQVSASYTSLGMEFTDKRWSIPIIMSCVSAGLSGVLLGYLFMKVASVLRHLEDVKNQSKT